ncbi:hypothetical protein FKW77_000180 [Venturia effusa]|uniref:Zn(2)-C6 fungal-type domain-containing protein n=1 Tax=Venturia effusa TaxID=50376 RepID=A0A517LPB9_9PEZI|nr:hypothetical protein FKW77_000180 [Venturia effusa]
MAGPGGGPSRRSHTKSRKGCKTCKRRHIRCDETFPQCRNCTKHQVRCDYMDSATPGDEPSRFSGQPNLLWTTEIDRNVELWRQTGQFPFPELHIFPQPPWQTLSKTELRLIYHVASVCYEMQSSRTSQFTIWTELMPKFLSIAATHSFVMHSVLAFSANHLAWITQSAETRNIAYHHGGIAMKGLHEAIGAFSKNSADAALAASLLLSWQSTDWRGWASLMTGTKTILNAMQNWRSESALTDLMSQQSILSQHIFTNDSSFVSTEMRQDHLRTLSRVGDVLQRLQPYLTTCEQESRWIDQLSGYVQRLRNSDPPSSSEDQFRQLYALRKWLFWVPVILLSSRKGDIFTLLVLSHFYAVALTLEPLFSHIGAPFLGSLALPPLGELIKVINTVQSSDNFSSMTQAAATMMEFPREALATYKARRVWVQVPSPHVQVSQPPYGLETLNLDLRAHMSEYGHNQSLSPAFAPSPLHNGPPTTLSTPSSGTLPRSPFLEVPRSSGVEVFAYSSAGSTYSAPQTLSHSRLPVFKQEEDSSSSFNFNSTPYGYSASVAPPVASIWT